MLDPRCSEVPLLVQGHWGQHNSFTQVGIGVASSQTPNPMPWGLICLERDLQCYLVPSLLPYTHTHTSACTHKHSPHIPHPHIPPLTCTHQRYVLSMPYTLTPHTYQMSHLQHHIYTTHTNTVLQFNTLSRSGVGLGGVGYQVPHSMFPAS